MKTVKRSRLRWLFQCHSAVWLPTQALCLLGGLLTARGQDQTLNPIYPKDTNVSMNCIWFRTAGVLLPIVSHLTNPQRADARPALASQGNESNERRTFNQERKFYEEDLYQIACESFIH